MAQQAAKQGMLAIPLVRDGLVADESRKLQWIPLALEPPLAGLSSAGFVPKGSCMPTFRSRNIIWLLSPLAYFAAAVFSPVRSNHSDATLTTQDLSNWNSAEGC